MFCPNCGARNDAAQKFCRSCGLNLEAAALSLLEQMPSAGAAELSKRERALERFGNFAFAGFGIVLSLGVGALIYMIAAKMIFTGASVFAGLILIAFMVFALLSLAYVYFREDLKERREKTRPVLSNELGGGRETGKPLAEKTPAPAATVTENSTELLFAERKTRKFE